MEVEGKAASGVPEELRAAQVLTGGSPHTGADQCCRFQVHPFYKGTTPRKSPQNGCLRSLAWQALPCNLAYGTNPNPRENGIRKGVQRIPNSEKYSKMA